MTWTEHYGLLDRFVHRTAFASTGIQKIVADMEDTLFQPQLAGVSTDKPVFVTSLPRAGTTLLLDRLSSLPEFATHTYRSMPFLLCPLLWDRLSNGFRKDGKPMERAHGDGMQIDFDSAEAFEEALWQAWWPEKYADERIAPWSAADEHDEFDTFFTNHLRKIIVTTRQRKGPAATRYLSKNNANIIRIDKLVSLFPDAHIVVPVREPVSHIASLHRQHLRFLKAHDDDAFARDYMRAIGHRDFGANLAPLAFAGFDADANRATEMQFWLDYWIAAYSMLAANKCDRLTFVCYEELCAEPAATLSWLVERLNVTCSDLAELAADIKSQNRRTPIPDEIDRDKLDEAAGIYRYLKQLASRR